MACCACWASSKALARNASALIAQAAAGKARGEILQRRGGVLRPAGLAERRSLIKDRVIRQGESALRCLGQILGSLGIALAFVFLISGQEVGPTAPLGVSL